MNLATLTRFKEGTFEGIWKGNGCNLHYNVVDMARYFGVGMTAIATEYDFEKICDCCDGLVIPGSPLNIDPSYWGGEPFDPPNKADEFALDSKVIAAFAERGKPIFGICGGHQAINVVFGGSLIRVADVRGEKFEEPHCVKIKTVDRFGNALKYTNHKISIEKDSFLYDVFGSTSAIVNSYHGWAIDRVAPGFRVVATTQDGIIEAIENKERKIYATQWHPELAFRMGYETEKKLFENFLKVCASSK